MARIVRVAAAQYPVEEIASAAAFEAKLSRWVEQAAAKGAQLLVFPEYAAMELVRIAGLAVASDMRASIEALQSYIGDYEAAYAQLSRRHGVFILAGSAPIRLADGRYVNQARLFGPKGGSVLQQKNMMTRFEAEKWGISANSGLCVFDIGIAKVGVAICYDAEFPLIPRALAEGGAEICSSPRAQICLPDIIASGMRAPPVRSKIRFIRCKFRSWAKRRGAPPWRSMSAPPGFSLRPKGGLLQMAYWLWATSTKRSGFTATSISNSRMKREETAMS